MTTKQQEKQHAVQEQEGRREQDAAIGNRVMRALGHPPDLHQVQVRRLWADHYRVNVFVGADGVSARVAHSYFLAADGAGNITTCTPTITKQY
jgi:hypothetical protein